MNKNQHNVNKLTQRKSVLEKWEIKREKSLFEIINEIFKDELEYHKKKKDTRNLKSLVKIIELI